MEKLINKINLIGAAAVTLLSALFGGFWYLFLAFAALNVLDYVTGIIKSKVAHTENSVKGFNGIVKKLGSWVVVAIAFFLAVGFKDIGRAIGIDLGFTVFIGWFTLCTLIINEIRSVLENLVEIGVDVPPWLVKGLEAANDKLKDIGE
ncbi:MAG: phage holin family protein [Clostridia bacterium]|nr:phage holin family protein [Clostridia bacterium]